MGLKNDMVTLMKSTNGMTADHKGMLLEIWGLAGQLGEKLESLDKIEANRRQRAAIVSAQAQYRDWRGINLGELLNLFGLPPEKRS